MTTFELATLYILLLTVPYSGGWLELAFWSCEKNCGYHIAPTKWCTSVYFALFDVTSSCSSMHYIYIYLWGAYLLFLLVSLSIFLFFSWLYMFGYYCSMLYKIDAGFTYIYKKKEIDFTSGLECAASFLKNMTQSCQIFIYKP